MPVTTSRVTLDVGSSPMQAFVATPADPGPGLIIFQEAFGVNAHIRDVAQRYAASGFTAIAPELFHRTAAPGTEIDYGDWEAVKPHRAGITADGIVDDARAAYDWLKSQGIAAERIACVGYCMGGFASYLTNAALPLAGAISYYGSVAPEYFDRAARQHGPILMFWGGLDEHIPPASYRPLADALTSAGVEHEQVVFSKADHGFNCDARPAYNEGAARQAYALVLEFLRVRRVLE